MSRYSSLLKQRESEYSALRLKDGHFCILESRSGDGNMIFTISTNGAIIGSNPSSLTGDYDMVPMKLDDQALQNCHIFILFKNQSFYLNCINNAELLLRKNVSGENSACLTGENSPRSFSNDSLNCDVTRDVESTKHCYLSVPSDDPIILDDGDMIILGSFEFRVSLYRRDNSHIPNLLNRKSDSVSFCYEPNFRWRNSMEDRIHIEENWFGVNSTFVGVYDGHGGGIVADFACTVLHQHLRRALEFGIDCVTAFDKAYERTNQGILGIGEMGKYSGCTAVTLVLMPQREGKSKSRLVVANVGDSQAILSRQGQAFRLSSAHTCANEAEVERIRSCGGCVVHKRLMGLSVTRALGDLSLSSYGLSAKPFICDVLLDANEAEFVIAATDGLWEAISPQEAVDLVRGLSNPQDMSQKLVQEAIARKSRDNISIAVMFI